MKCQNLKTSDPEVYAAIKGEEERELAKIVLIASENNVSPGHPRSSRIGIYK